MGRIAILCGLGVGLAPVAAFAFPVLRLLLDGDIDSVGRAGSGVFLDPQREGMLLTRPSGLAKVEGPQLRMAIEHESTLDIRASQLAGTRAGNLLVGVNAVAPVELGTVKATVGALYRREDGTIRVRSDSQRLLVMFDHSRDIAAAGMAVKLARPLTVALSGELSGGSDLGFTAEAMLEPLSGLGVGARHRQESFHYLISTEPIHAKSFATPPLGYKIDQVRALDELELSIALLPYIRLLGLMNVSGPRDAYLELGSRLGPFEIRSAIERKDFTFNDFARAEGSGNLARMALAIERERWISGIDLATPIGHFDGRFVAGSIDAESSAREIGNAASHAILAMDLDLDLFANTSYRVLTRQVQVGYRRGNPRGFDWMIGLQLARVTAHGGYSYGADRYPLSGAEPLVGNRIELAAGALGLCYRWGNWTARYSIVQFVPLAAQSVAAHPPGPAPDPQPAPEPSPGPSPEPTPGPTLWEKTRDMVHDYRGGNLQMFEVRHDF